MSETVGAIDPWYLQHLACPRDHGRLLLAGGRLCCDAGHAYPVIDGIPVMLTDDEPHTVGFVAASLDRARGTTAGDPRAPHLYLESLGISEDEKRGVVEMASRPGPIDPVVAFLVAATNGLMYRQMIGRLDRYPVPSIRLPRGHGRLLLDVGCSWGRWCFAASEAGYEAVGIDPSLGAVMAARRVAAAKGVTVRLVVGDARALPFRPALFDCTYSYSVLQHFSKADAERSLAEMGRVLRPGGHLKVQMPTVLGLRCLYHQLRRRFREAKGFEVRYWTLPALARVVRRHVGPASFEVDGYFGIGLQPTDAPLMSPKLRLVLRVSELGRRASRHLRPLRWVADSVFVEATKPA